MPKKFASFLEVLFGLQTTHLNVVISKKNASIYNETLWKLNSNYKCKPQVIQSLYEDQIQIDSQFIECSRYANIHKLIRQITI